ncbi:hypothetical protein [Rhodopirellula sp. SWK7]|uniref:hypothetical protein n=1 Tax=Rhodopirellula sp. SWK7 TaxID=595460 RepID=UPI0005C6CA9C|nr:hypothetical protein [Rhodopirellula sp. SWK7]
MDDWHLRLFLAIRASQRSLRESEPLCKLKRQRNTLQRIGVALRCATELSASRRMTPSLRKRILDGANAANALFDDVNYGPNDLDLPIGDTDPASSVRATMMAAFSVIFWLESCSNMDANARDESADAFHDHVDTAMRTGLPLDTDVSLACTYNWSGAFEYNVMTDEDDLFCLADPGP